MSGNFMNGLATGIVKSTASATSDMASSAVNNAYKAGKRAGGNEIEKTPAFLQNVGNIFAKKELTSITPEKAALFNVSNPYAEEKYHTYETPDFWDYDGRDLSDETVEQHKADFQKYVDDRNEDAKRFNTLMNNVNFAQSTVDKSASVSENQLDSGYNRYFGENLRRFSDENGNFSIDGENLWMPISVNKAPDAALNVYDDYFAKLDKKGWKDEDAISNNWTHGVIDPYLIDDGADPRSRQALFMTGRQYKRYIQQLGMPGRNLLDINDDMIYSKQDEMEKYGFIPYITNDIYLDNYRAAAAPRHVSNIFNNVAHSRRHLFGDQYKITKDGKEISGNLFDNRFQNWRNSVGAIDPSKVTLLSDRGLDGVTENSVPLALYVGDSNNYIVDMDFTTDASGIVTLDNGDRIPLSEADVRYEPAINGETIYAYYDTEPLELEDGTMVNPLDAYLIEAAEVAENSEDDNLSASDYGVSIDYGKYGLGNPYPKFVESPVARTWDLMAQSVPYFHPATGIAKGISDSLNDSTGISYLTNFDGSYSMIQHDPTADELWGAATGSAMMPFTEMIIGPLGASLFKASPSRFLTQKTVNSLGKLLGREKPVLSDEIATKIPVQYLFGASDEGLEEIPGNITEHIQSDGYKNWESDRVYNPETGRMEYVDTPWPKKVSNFGQEIPSSYGYGTLLGGILGPLNRGKYLEERRKYKEDAVRKAIEDSKVKLSDEVKARTIDASKAKSLLEYDMDRMQDAYHDRYEEVPVVGSEIIRNSNR